MERLDPKQPYDEYYLEFDFSDLLEDQGETGISIDSVTVVDLSDDDQDVTSTVCDTTQNATNGLKAYVWCRAGTDGHLYKFTVRVTGDTSGEKYELDATLPVQEI